MIGLEPNTVHLMLSDRRVGRALDVLPIGIMHHCDGSPT